MAVGNPSVTDDVTGELFVMDDAGFAKFKAKYDHVQMGMSPDAFRVIVEAINLYKRTYKVGPDDFDFQLLDSIGYVFAPVEE